MGGFVAEDSNDPYCDFEQYHSGLGVQMVVNQNVVDSKCPLQTCLPAAVPLDAQGVDVWVENLGSYLAFECTVR